MGTPVPDAVKRLVDRFDQDRKVVLTDWQLSSVVRVGQALLSASDSG
jgi:hypothetical protein